MNVKMPGKPLAIRTGLKTKLIVIVISVGTIPLVLAMVLSYMQGHQSLKRVIGSSFQALAYETSTKMDLLLNAEIHKISTLARHPTLTLLVREQNEQLAALSPQGFQAYIQQEAAIWNQSGLDEPPLLNNGVSRILINRLQRDNQSKDSTVSFYVTDASGLLVASANRVPAFFQKAPKAAQTRLVETLPEIGIVKLVKDPKTETFVFEITAPIRDKANTPIGLLHRAYGAKKFFSPSVEPIIFGETGHVMLINSEGVVLDCPILPTGFRLADPDLVKAVTLPRANWAETHNDGHGNRELSIIGFSPLQQTNDVIERSKGHQWFTFAWQSSDELFAPMRNLLAWMSSAGFASLLLIAALGAAAANSFVRPIHQLQKTASAIGRGEKVEPLHFETGDEIEGLAEEINTMDSLLKKAFLGLEQKVEEKTREVLYLKEYNESILMSVPEVILIFDQDQKVEYANAAFERVTGIDSRKVIDHTLGQIPLGNRETWDQIRQELKQYGQSNNAPVGARGGLRKRDYRARDPLAPPSHTAEDSQNTVALGEQIFAYQFFEVVLKAKGGGRTGLIMKDITEEKKLLDQLTMTDKLSGLGTMAAGIAHEMNNPLYSIMGFTEAIKEEKDFSKIQRYADKVLDRSRHMASVILNLAGYSRSNEKDPHKDININERIDAATEMALMASYSKDIQLEKYYSEVPHLSAKPEEIQQVFHNIIRNSVQAMDGKGQISITSAQENGQIVVTIKDSGPGIPREHLSRVFDPFFTTKEQGKGTGLGLNIAHRIVKKYGGDIRVESEKGKGAVFTVSFPV